MRSEDIDRTKLGLSIYSKVNRAQQLRKIEPVRVETSPSPKKSTNDKNNSYRYF